MNKNENPIINSPHDLRELLFENNKGTPKPINGKAKIVISTLNPKRETFAPIMTAIDCPNVINPAFTKLTTITVEADEL